MSKILELLHYTRKGGEGKKEERGDFSNQIPSENLDSSIKEKLADTYMLTTADGSGDIKKKSDKKILPHKYDAGTSKIKIVQLIPWLISFLAVLLLLINIVYRGRINISVEIVPAQPVSELATPAASGVPVTLPAEEGLEPEEKPGDITPIAAALIAEGEFNRYVIKKFGFYGAALNRSKITQDGLFLFNDGTVAWASAGFDFVKPMDLSSSTLDFFVKGLNGSESLDLILRDAENNSYFPQAHNLVFDENMEDRWQFVSVPFSDFSGTYNVGRINHVGIEFGTQTTLNKPGASIYIRNIKMMDAARRLE